MNSQKSGIIVLNKPTNISSNSAVNKVKKILGAKKVGHLGTLDPLASGVLPITIGKATRLFDFFLNKNKVYSAVFAFGFETSTLDCEGEIISIDKKFTANFEKIKQTVNTFVGKQLQMPPAFSAKKIDGKKAYEFARNGQLVNLKPKEIEIFSISVKEIEEETKEKIKNFFFENNKDINLSQKREKLCFNNMFSFEICCSSGTYIRSLCRDIAKKLGTVGTMTQLVRTKAGGFSIEDAKTFDEISLNSILDMDKFIDLPTENISLKQKEDLLCGKDVYFESLYDCFKLYYGNVFLGIASAKNNQLKINTFLMEE